MSAADPSARRSADGSRSRGRSGGEGRTVDPPRPENLIPTQRARRERIVDNAFEFLVHHEYDEIQVRDIADQADVALGTVYRYFTSKEHLFAAVLVKWGDALRTRVRQAPLNTTDVAGQLTEVYLRAIDAFARRPQFFRVLVTIENTTDPHARELYREFTAVSSEAFMEPLAVLAPAQASAVTNTLLPVLNGVLRAWVNGALGIDEARQRMTDAISLIFSAPPEPRPGA